MEALVEGKPEILIHNGEIKTAVLDGAQISHHELVAAVRRAGLSEVGEVHVAILETNGQITVVPRIPPRLTS